MSKHYKTINLISWAILATFVIINLVFIINSAVNIPYWDEWAIVNDLPNISLTRLFTPHNEHLIVTTKLYVYLQYAINDLNFKYMIIINYFFFIGMALSLYLIIKNYTKDIAFTPLLFIPLFSPSLISGYLFAFLISLTLMTTFGLLAIYFGFIRERNNRNTVIMIIFMTLSAISTSYSFPTGVMIAYILKEIIYISKSDNQHRAYEIARVVITFIIFIFTVLMPFYIFQNNEINTVISPLSFFINHFLQSCLLVTTLMRSSNLLIIIPCCILVSIPILTFIINKDVFKDKSLQACYAIVICTIINVAGVSLIRGINEASLSSRHLMFTIVVIPVLALLFVKLYMRYKNKLTILISFLYISILTTSIFISFNQYPIDKRYAQINQSRQYGYDCVKAYYTQGGGSLCQPIFPVPLDYYLKRAYELQLSFVKEY